MKSIAAALVALSCAVGSLSAQSRDTVIVMTVPLKHMTSQDAAQLLTPYVVTTPFEGRIGGGVFPTPDGQGVTIRETAQNYARMLTILAKYDRSPSSVSFTFQLIVADRSNRRAPEIASLDTLLRSVLKYTGYSLIGVGVLNTSANSGANGTITGEGQKYLINIETAEIRTVGTDVSVTLPRVELLKYTGWSVGGVDANERLLRTGVTVPMGQTVVLGTAALDSDRAIILTVRPQLSSPGGRARDE